MAPDTRLRLAAIRKALEDIIVPLIPAEASFAQEQLGLILRSIDIVRDQIPHEEAFLIHDAHAFAALGRALGQHAAPQDTCAAPLREAVARVEAICPARAVQRSELEQAVGAMRACIEQAVEEIGADAARLAAIAPLILTHTETQTLLERRWVVGTGFDPAPEALPALDQILYPATTEAIA